MNREIKFRGKRIDNDEWVYGYLHFGFNCTDEYVPFISWKDSSYLGDIGEEEINIKTIGQCTGLHDKNGKEIYRGDIVQGLFADQEESEIKGQVIYSKGQASYIVIASNNDEWELGYLDNLEVIGNIYDNPELLGGE